jgi:DNA (cytosine-5)-methyltransferase 1
MTKQPIALTCADLFCGAGGFSEGFRQAGFRVTTAVDTWSAAIDTHLANHPETTALKADLLTLDPSRVGPVDVLIGSPPCTEFSFAKRGGHGDIETGLRLVYRFLRFVYELKPKWWVMENVPRTFDFLYGEVPLRKLGLGRRGVLEIPQFELLVASDYGAPQKRTRLFSGHFPVPKKTHSAFRDQLPAWRTLGDVVGKLPDPNMHPQLGEQVEDPIYGFSLPAHQLTDHFSDRLELTPQEVEEIRRSKTEHSWYGKMVFPDSLHKPARTVVATQLRPNREAIVVETASGHRRLTVREASSVQSFPITYQWWGKTESLRYKLVGNAVPPLMAQAIAIEIARAEQVERPETPYVIRSVLSASADLELTGQRPRSHSIQRKFRDHVEGSKTSGHRIDVENLAKRLDANPGWYVGSRHPHHVVGWQAVLYRGSGKRVRRNVIAFEQAAELLALTIADQRSAERAGRLLEDLEKELVPLVPDATTLQAIWSGRLSGLPSPYELLGRVSNIVDRHYKNSQTLFYIRPARSPRWVPPRTAAHLVAAAYLCDLANRGVTWLADHHEEAFPPAPGARQSQRLRRDDLPGAQRRVFEQASKRCRPRDESERRKRAEIEQLVLTG